MAALNNINYGSGQDTMQDVFDKTNDAIDRINNYYGEIKVTRFNIGAWNMQSNPSINVDTGLAYATYSNKIIGVDYLIYNDSGVADPTMTSTGEAYIIVGNYIDNAGQLRITLNRNGQDLPSHNDGVINRGYIYLRTDMTL